MRGLASSRRRWLPHHDAARFATECEHTIDHARTSHELDEVDERWREIAILQADPDAYRRSRRQATELATGESSPANEAPDDKPLEANEAQPSI